VAFYEEEFSSGVRGELTNTTDDAISYTEVTAKFYNDEGTRLGDSLDNVSDLGGEETYAFEVLSLLTGEKADAVASYTLTVSEGF